MEYKIEDHLQSVKNCNQVHSQDHINSQDDTEGSLTHNQLNNSGINDKSLQDAIDVLQKCKEMYKEHKLEEAYRLMKQFERLRETIKEDLEAYLKLFSDESMLFESIIKEHTYLMKVLAELESTEEWKCDTDDHNVKIHYKKAHDNDLIIIKMEAEVDVPLLHLLSMINEVELWKLWNAFMNYTTEVVKVKTLHRAAKVYYVEYGLPYPLTNREIHLYGIGVNRLYENGTVVILAQSVDNDQEFFGRHDIQKVQHNGTINIDVHVGAFEITPLGRNKSILRGVANMNPKFNWIPRSILNWVLRKGTKQMVEKIIAGARHFKGSPWEKEIYSERKREFYEWLEGQLEEYHLKKEAKQDL